MAIGSNKSAFTLVFQLLVVTGAFSTLGDLCQKERYFHFYIFFFFYIFYIFTGNPVCIRYFYCGVGNNNRVANRSSASLGDFCKAP